jgi:hypothetical protein
MKRLGGGYEEDNAIVRADISLSSRFETPKEVGDEANMQVGHQSIPSVSRTNVTTWEDLICGLLRPGDATSHLATWGFELFNLLRHRLGWKLWSVACTAGYVSSQQVPT